MASSSVRINGSATPIENIVIGATATLTNFNDTGATTWAWVILSKPNGSTATIAAPTASTTTFTADLEGTYLIQLTVNGSLVSTAVARVLALHTGIKILGHNEIDEGDSAGLNGWARPSRDSALLLDKRLGLATRKTVKFTGANTTGPLLLKITGSATLGNGDAVPTVDLAASLAGYGALVFFDKTVGINANDVVSVVVSGFTDLFTNPDTLILEDKVYTSSTPGALTKTQASDNAVIVGYCAIVSGGNVRLWFGAGQKAGAQALTLSAFGSAPDAKGATLTGYALQLQPTDGTHPGLVSLADQVMGGGNKTFGGEVISTYAGVGGAATGHANFSVPNNPANSSPALANFNSALELGGRYYSSVSDGSACIYLGALCNKTAGPILTVLNSYGGIGGTEHSVCDVNWNGDTKIGGSLYVGQLGGSSGRVISPDYLYLDALNTQIVANHGSNTNNIIEWYSGVGFTLKATLSNAGTFATAIASGSDAFKMLDGARVNFSTADASAYLYRSAANTISTPGALTADSVTLAAVSAINLGATSRIIWGGGNYISNNAGSGCLANTSGYESSIASGSNALKMLDGARVNFSTADSACYMWRGAANEIHSAAFLVADGASSGFWDKAGNGYYVDAGGTKRLHYTGTQIAVNGSFVIENGGMDVANAQDIRMRDGGKLNLSTADANAYFYRSAANTISTPGSMVVTGTMGIGHTLTLTGGALSPVSLSANIDSNFFYCSTSLRSSVNIYADGKIYGGVASGSNQFELNSGARLHFAPGENAYLYRSAVDTITTLGDFRAANLTLTGGAVVTPTGASTLAGVALTATSGAGGAGSGVTAGGVGGAVSITAGAGGVQGTGVGGAGGAIAITSGAAGAAGGAAGGAMTLLSGTGGSSDASHGSSAGGLFTIAGGTGGSAAAGGNGNGGGPVLVSGGTGGSNDAANHGGGTGGDLTLKSGNGGPLNGGATGSSAGAVSLDAGVLTGSAARATITIGGTNAGNIKLGVVGQVFSISAIPSLPDYTDDSANTGSRTVNKTQGVSAFATATQTITITNSLCTTNSIVYGVLLTNDGTTGALKCIIPASGSFEIRLTSNASGTVKVAWFIMNHN